MNRAGAAILDIGSHLHRLRIFRALGSTLIVLTCAVFAWGLLASSPARSQSVLPFPDPPSDSVAKRTLQESEYRPNPPVSRLPENAPNILIVLMDDVGPAQSRTFGGDIATPTMDQIVAQGIAYNRFHTTAMCSPTRASLLTGRNHHWVGNGQIAELANDWDGYSGVIPQTSATLAEVLKITVTAPAHGANGTTHPRSRRPLRARLTIGQRVMGLSISMDFSPAKRRNGNPIWSATQPMSIAPKPLVAMRITTSARILPMMRSPGCASTRRLHRTSRSSCIGPRAHRMARTMFRANGRTNIAGCSMMAGMRRASVILPLPKRRGGFRPKRS